MICSSATNPAGAAERGPDDQAAARQALAQVVVGVALQAQGDAAGQEGAEALPGRAGEGDVDGAVGQAGAAVAAGHLGPEQGADRPVDVADRHGDLDRDGVVEGRPAGLDQGAVEGPVQAVVLGPDAVAGRVRAGVGGSQDRGEVEARGPSSGRRRSVMSISSGWPMTSSRERKPERGQQLADLLGDVLEEVDDELRPAA